MHGFKVLQLLDLMYAFCLSSANIRSLVCAHNIDRNAKNTLRRQCKHGNCASQTNEERKINLIIIYKYGGWRYNLQSNLAVHLGVCESVLCMCAMQKTLAAHKFMHMQTIRCTEIEITANHPKRKTNSTQSSSTGENKYSHKQTHGNRHIINTFWPAM